MNGINKAVRLYPNLLLVGPETKTNAALPRLLSGCRTPVHEVAPAHTTRLPNTGTLVLRGVITLDTAQQQALLAWLTEHADRLQVVTVTVESLFSGVQSGTFLDALFYRLNIVTLTGTDLDSVATVRALQSSTFPGTVAS